MRVIKRDGRIVKFNPDKVVIAVSKALKSIGEVDDAFAQTVADTVSGMLNGSKEISVEDIQDKVEDVLIKSGRAKLAKAYILYRAKRAEVRDFRDAIGLQGDELKLGVNALALLKQRYLKAYNGVKETPSQLFRRVARHVASVEKGYGNNPEYWSKVFYNLMANQIFMPNTPCLSNAGNQDLNYLFACYAFEVGDSMEEILQTAKDCGMVQKCIPSDSPILTEKCVKKAGDVIVGDKIWSKNGFVSVNTVYNVGKKDSIALKVDGTDIVLGKEHLVYTKLRNRTNEFRWVKACELNENKHLVAVYSKEPDTCNYNIKGEFIFNKFYDSYRRNSYNDYNVPETISVGMAYSLGLWFGDGGQDSLRFRFFNKDANLHQLFRNGFGDLKYSFYSGKNGNTDETCYNNKKLVSFVNFLGFKDKTSIPSCVFGWADNLKFAFIEGLLDTDGSIKKQGHVCVVSNKNLKTIEDVKHLLKTLGYSSFISATKYGWCLYLYSSGVQNISNKFVFDTRKKRLIKSILPKHSKGVLRDGDLEFHKVIVEGSGVSDMVDFEVSGHTYNVASIVTHNSGGGVGLNLSKLRPTGATVKSTQGIASGPVTFMRIFNTISDVIKQGGIRRGGNLGLLLVNHPDIIDFIQCKKEEGNLSNFNISVGITDEFMEAVNNDSNFSLINPKTGEVVQQVNARHLFRFIAESAWSNGEPGFVFWDKVEKDNPTPSKGHLIKNLALAKGTFVFTDKGIERIENIQGYGNTLTDLRTINSKGTSIVPLRVLPAGKEPTFIVKLDNGQSISLTANHKLYTFTGDTRRYSTSLSCDKFVRTDELKIGDNVCVQEHSPLMSFNEDDVRFGRVVGWLLGDGSISKVDNHYQYSFISKDDNNFAMNYIEDFISAFSEATFKPAKGGIKVLQLNNKRANEVFYGLTEERTIPDAYLSNISICKGILQGLFSTDGNASKYTRHITVSSINEDKIKKVQLILSYFGIKSSYYKCRTKSVKYKVADGTTRSSKHNDIYTLAINGSSTHYFTHKIGFYMAKYKDDILSTYNERVIFDKPFARVVSIIPNGTEDVYEVTANVTHSLIANGIVVSNCGEQDLLPYEACVLGSINLAKFVEDGQIIYSSLRKVVNHAVRFLDNVIDASNYPLKKIEDIVKSNRKIGLGVMGFADMLFMLGIPYDSYEAEKLGGEIMGFINAEAKKASCKLAEERGGFPNIGESTIKTPQRNATITTIAPTGSISIIAETSSGIEPVFAIVYQKTNILENQTFFEVNPVFENIAKIEGWYSQTLISKIIKNGGKVGGIPEVPDKWQHVFRTALEISPDAHVRMQAAFQRNVNNSISKTINMPFNASVEDVENIIKQAYELNLKGLTVFRNKSRRQQVLELCPECEDGSCPIDK